MNTTNKNAKAQAEHAVAKVEEVKGNTAVAAVNDIPDYMKGKQGAGTENLDSHDMEIPRIKLIQALSPELQTFNGLKPGEFWHTLAETSIGREVRISPIYIDRRFILWRPRKAGGGILARADDGVNWSPANTDFQVTLPETKKTVTWRTGGDVADVNGRVLAKNVGTVDASGLANWGSYDPSDANSQPAATLMYTLVVALPDYPEMGFAQLTLQRGAVKVAKNLIGKIRMHRAPSYGRVFRMASVEEQGQSGSFMNYKFVADGFVPADVFPAYEALYEQFKSKGLNIKDLDDLQDDASNPAHEGKGNDKDF